MTLDNGRHYSSACLGKEAKTTAKNYRATSLLFPIYSSLNTLRLSVSLHASHKIRPLMRMNTALTRNLSNIDIFEYGYKSSNLILSSDKQYIEQYSAKS